MKQRTPVAREAYVKAREADASKRSSKAESWNRLCEDLELDVNGTKKLIYQLANSYRKGHTQKPFNIKAQGSDTVLTEPHEIKECWTNYFSSLLNVQQHQELTTMSEPTAVVLVLVKARYLSFIANRSQDVNMPFVTSNVMKTPCVKNLLPGN